MLDHSLTLPVVSTSLRLEFAREAAIVGSCEVPSRRRAVVHVCGFMFAALDGPPCGPRTLTLEVVSTACAPTTGCRELSRSVRVCVPGTPLPSLECSQAVLLYAFVSTLKAL